MLDLGLEKDDLETKYALQGDVEEANDYSITRDFRFYKNGKWTGGKRPGIVVYRAEFDGKQYPDHLGYASVYFKHNPETQKFEPARSIRNRAILVAEIQDCERDKNAPV